MEQPGYLQYGEMMNMNPIAYGQAQEQVGLARQWQAEQQKQAELKSLSDLYATQQSQQMNPLLLEQQRLTNAGKGMANEDGGMSLGIRKATYPQELQAKIDDFATKADETKLKSIEQKINLAYLSGDPQQVDQAKQAEGFLASVRASREKHAQALAIQQEQTRSHIGGINAQGKNALELENRQFEHGKYNRSSGTGLTLIQSLNKKKVAERLGDVGAILTSGVNPATGEELTDIEKLYFKAMYEQDTRTVDAGNAKGGAGQGLTGGKQDGKIVVQEKSLPSVAGKKAPSVAEMREALKR